VPRTALLGDGPMRGSYPFPRRQRSGADEGLWRQHGRSCKERVTNRSDPRPARYRPGPLRWFWYAVGGRLPDRYRPWVLHDLTCRTWPLRHLARLVAQLAPVAIVLVLLLPGPLWIRVMGALGGSLVGLFYSFVFLYEATEGRAAKAGYPHGTLHEVRNERQTERALRRAAADFDRTWHHERHRLWPRH
jgi:hypothetical protein